MKDHIVTDENKEIYEKIHDYICSNPGCKTTDIMHEFKIKQYVAQNWLLYMTFLYPIYEEEELRRGVVRKWFSLKGDSYEKRKKR